MLKKLKNSFIFICLISLLTGCVNQNQEVQTNEEVTIAATSVSITEILDQLDVPAKQVVCIPQSDSYSVPKKYKKATQLGNAMSPDMEKLSTLKPDLILSPNSLEGDLASKYEKIKISSSFLNLKSLSGMYKSIEELGKFFNKEKKAQKFHNQQCFSQPYFHKTTRITFFFHNFVLEFYIELNIECIRTDSMGVLSVFFYSYTFIVLSFISNFTRLVCSILLRISFISP